jgi:hypothetical protein
LIVVRYYVANEFSIDEEEQIRTGVSLWAAATAGRVVSYQDPYPIDGEIEFGSYRKNERVVVFNKIESSSDYVRTWDEYYDKIIIGMKFGNPFIRSDIYLVSDRLVSSKHWESVAAHEFGHVLGVDHVVNGNSIMSEFYKIGNDTITLDDLSAFCTVHEYECCFK